MNKKYMLLLLIIIFTIQAVASQPIVKKDSLVRFVDLGLNNTWNTFKVGGKLMVAENYVMFTVRRDSLFLKNRFYQFNNRINDLLISISDIKNVRRKFDFNPTNFSGILVIKTNDRIKYKFYCVEDKKEILLFIREAIQKNK